MMKFAALALAAAVLALAADVAQANFYYTNIPKFCFDKTTYDFHIGGHSM